jgi:hypothetical protein
MTGLVAFASPRQLTQPELFQKRIVSLRCVANDLFDLYELAVHCSKVDLFFLHGRADVARDVQALAVGCHTGSWYVY